MSADAQVHIDGDALHRFLNGPEGPVGRELERRALKVESAAKRACPVDTGRLRASLNHRLSTDGQGLLAIVGTNVAYAPFVEFGTSRAHAQPFLRPALFEGTR